MPNTHSIFSYTAAERKRRYDTHTHIHTHVLLYDFTRQLHASAAAMCTRWYDTSISATSLISDPLSHHTNSLPLSHTQCLYALNAEGIVDLYRYTF